MLVVQYRQGQQKSIFCLLLGDPGIVCIADFKENYFLMETVKIYCGFLSFIDKCVFIF